jgi:hypothetical protein
MADKIKINYGGEEVEATPLEINQSQEQWNHYLLDDGSVVKIKLVATKVLRIENKFDDERNPVYLVKSTNIMNVSSPEQLKRKG